jgi:hypothetical protein
LLVLEWREEKRKDPNKSDGDIIAALRTRLPWQKWSQDTLRRKLPIARQHHGDNPPPIAAKSTDGPAIEVRERDQWQSLLQKYGLSPEEACDLVNLLITRAGAVHRLAYLGQLFVFVRRRLWWSRERKVAWLRRAAEEMEHRWPVMQRGSGKTFRVILDAIRDGCETKKEIVAATGLGAPNVSTHVMSMCRDGDIVCIGRGRYAWPKEGLPRYVPMAEAILKALAEIGRPATVPEIQARAGLRENQGHSTLYGLRKRGKVIMIKPGVYALPGAGVPFVPTKDAINEALRSGSKSLPEIVAITGKTRDATWRALRIKKARGEVIQAYLIHVGRGGGRSTAAFALPPSSAHRRNARKSS